MDNLSNKKCSHPNCNFTRITDICNNGGTHCCFFCQLSHCSSTKPHNNHHNTCQKNIYNGLINTIENHTVSIMENKHYFNHRSLLYSPKYGLTIFNKNMYTEFINDNAFIFFKMLENNNIPYGIFAGNTLGYVRDKRNMYWVDDYDIIVFEEHREALIKLYNSDIFVENGFKHCDYNLSGFQIINTDVDFNIFFQRGKIDCPYFQCDIFLSKCVNNKVYNIGDWGLYHKKAMDKSLVLPFKKITLGNLELYSVNNPEKEIAHCYGDISRGILASHNVRSKVIVEDWRILDNFFREKIEVGIANVKRYLIAHTYESKINITKDIYKGVVDVLKYISEKKAKYLNVFDYAFLKKYVYDIRFYFPDLIINYYCLEDSIHPIYLNKCDNVYFKSKVVLDKYNSDVIIYIKKPTLHLTNLITFGTFDLFHKGHMNVFDELIKYSDNIVVGLSSKDFTYVKKNIYPTDNYEDRENNIVKYCNRVKTVFSEEQMDLKTEYIRKYASNLLVMGDDWSGKFDFVDCPVLYVKRTEGISSTLLRSQNESNTGKYKI